MNPMVVQCTSCLTKFDLDPRKVPAAGVRARCSVCSGVIVVPPPAVVASPASGAPRMHTPPYASPAYTRTPTPAQPVPVAPAPAASSAAPAWSPASQTASATVSQEPVVPPASAVLESVTAAPAEGTAPAAEGAARRPINPFLAKDPALRAKRLARALVSDIVAYHPARHAEGLRDGTLKALFRDEIKKSYDEYVEQVGREFAESTTHFMDALNDVLAGGKKLF